jgi:hypothetical protein
MIVLHPKQKIIFMKKTFLLLQLVAIIFFCSSATAQDRKPVSEPYWVVESNVKTPRHSVVHFYNSDNVLMYKETIDGKRVNINRPKTRRRLNDALKQVTLVWQKDNQMRAVKFLVAKML